ncbi:37S ribosomal protein S22 [Lignoscripta atroalba]|nr:37S ribosomal protein S22 [Lignoscripta atroalba]
MSLCQPARRICWSCRAHLLSLFPDGFCSSARKWHPRYGIIPPKPRTRALHSARRQPEAAQVGAGSINEAQDATLTQSPAQMEAVVRRARQTFGETLPSDFLSSEEYNIYERLYGPPVRETRPEDVGLLQELEDNVEAEDKVPRAALLRETQEGDLEEVDYEEKVLQEQEQIEDMHDLDQRVGGRNAFKARMMLYQDMAATMNSPPLEGNEVEADEGQLDFEIDKTSGELLQYEDSHDNGEGLENFENEDESSDVLRTHPLTAAGRFATSPATLQLPRDTFVDPITSLMANSSIKHLTEVAQRTFGGPGLPNSTATPASKRHLPQVPVALEASQPKMSEMEANVYLAAVMPGAYAAVMSTLVETRKRLGSEWLAELMKKEGGPRFLDAGAGGAGILAWRDILKAEWERRHSDSVADGDPPPKGKSTVIVGSSELRRRASHLLENTTFLPRLPDYLPARDLPAPQPDDSPPRKQYDVIVAPHTLWTLKADYMRKAHVQNLWSLLNPDGGVLILIEKGVPRGFEFIAAAREVLLNNQISSPDSLHIENELQNTSEGRFTRKEVGMIIAPCTNHLQCPMYTVPGLSKGRKDFCHFSQRYIRPPILQHLVGANDRNHEDVQFSYVAVRRGKDKRQTDNITQGFPATEAAFIGYGGHNLVATDVPGAQPQMSEAELPVPDPLSLPRSVLPPIKRRGHVILDLCTPTGRLERWTVPRSFSKQAFRDARKSQWGDIWALGAKTRVLRNIKLGKTDNGKKTLSKKVTEGDIGADEAEDSLKRLSGRKNKHEKRMKKGRKGQIREKSLEDDF